MDPYAENILEHFRNPLYRGKLADPTISFQETNIGCGDQLKIELKINDGKLDQIGWEGEGCAICTAAISLLADEAIRRMSVEEVDKLTSRDMLRLLGVPVSPRRMKCALLALHTLKNAIRKLQGRNPITWTELYTECMLDD